MDTANWTTETLSHFFQTHNRFPRADADKLARMAIAHRERGAQAAATPRRTGPSAAARAQELHAMRQDLARMPVYPLGDSPEDRALRESHWERRNEYGARMPKSRAQQRY